MVSGKVVSLKIRRVCNLRPAGLFCKTAMQYKSKITVHKELRHEEITANAKKRIKRAWCMR